MYRSTRRCTHTLSMDVPSPALLAGLGPYAAVDTHAPGEAAPAPWRPMCELVEDPAALDGRVRAVAAALGLGPATARGDLRVAASTAHLGLVARLVAPAVALAALGGAPFDQRPAELWWQDRLGGPYPLSVAPTGPGAGPAAADTAGEPVLGDAVGDLTAVIAGRYHVSPRVLWGNTASAVNSAASQLARERPDLAERGRQVAQALLSDPRLAQEPAPAGPGFRRASCCLIHRLAGPPARAVCGDCVLLS